MLQALLAGLTILHLGPGLAFALLAFGCDPGDAWLGDLCQQGTLRAFLGLTLAAWVVMVLAWWALRRWRSQP